MTDDKFFEIKEYEFDQNLLSKINKNHFVNGLWPLVYILSDGSLKEAYVGETTDAVARMSNHLKNNSKKRLTAVRLITSDKFNKSATLDIESNLIKYIAGDGQYKLLNGNLGLANHTYYQKNEVYWDIFKTIWGELRSEGITRNTLDHINNSDLFKYSPYKSLHVEQRESLIDIVKSLLRKDSNSIIVEGGAGTGKTILAIFLFKLLSSDIEDLNLKEFGEEEKEFIKLVKELRNNYPNPSMALVVPMAGFRSTLRKVFKNIKGLNSSMVIGPAEVAKRKFDLLVVDESHRLRKRINLGAYFGAFDAVNKKLGLEKEKGNELDWVVLQSNKSVLFYDKDQSIKPSDVNRNDFDLLKQNKKTIIKTLKSQFRVKGGNDYITYVNKLLTCQFRKNDEVFESKDYEFTLFDSLKKMVNKIKDRNNEFGLARLVAGYSWKWISKKKNIHDMEIDDVRLKWNSVASDWVNSSDSVNEVGCIHTTQGYDLNYTGIIFGNEISYNKERNEIVIKESEYFDKNGKQSIKDPNELKEYIVNIYKTLMFRGIKGTYIYVCDKNLRDYFKEHLLMEGNENTIDSIEEEIVSPYAIGMIRVPLIGSIQCGSPTDVQQDIEEEILVPKKIIRKDLDYFIVRARGDSMDKAGIKEGDLVLCWKKETAHDGDRVVALVDGNVTIKEYLRTKEGVTLKPRSSNPEHKDIIMNEGDTIQGIVQGVVERIIE